MVFSQELITIDENLFLGQGVQRKCYLHPQNHGLCVKILNSPQSKSQIRRIKSEIDYFKLLIKKNMFFDFIARYFGAADTNLGRGHVFETVRNYNGQISKSLDKILEDETFLSKNYNKIFTALIEFKNKLYDNAVVFRNTSAQNILLKELSGGAVKFVLIDDLGTVNFIAFEYYFKFLAKIRFKRYWDRFITMIETHNKKPSALKFAKDLREDFIKHFS
ncbi:MAG: hypothetical protein LBQ47_01835 [Endomicrobium sp.]|jgi:hypothetical protein|nr:hypothetical protein [Endomicrobium sp.]